jgi:hypothetical protein
MDTSTFDPTRAVVFDLNRGQVTLNGGAPALIISAEALAHVCGLLDTGAVRQFGSLLGKQAGARVRARLGAALLPTLEVMVDHLGGELCLGGLGSLAMERWGQALIVRIESCPLPASGHDLMSAYIESALLAVAGREVTALVLEQSAQSFRLLLCGKAASVKVKGWLGAGRSWGEALAALHHNPKNDVLGSRL